MLLMDAPYAGHLAAMPGARAALVEVEAREMSVLSSVVQRWAEETGGTAFDSRDYAALMERARSLDARTHLSEGLRDTVDILLARDACWALNRDRVEAFLGRAAELERARNALTQMDVTTSYFEERLQARQDCRQTEKEVPDEVAALRKELPKHELAAHPGAVGFQQDAIRKTEEKIRNRIAHDEEGTPPCECAGTGDCRYRRGTPQAWTAGVRARRRVMLSRRCRCSDPWRPSASRGKNSRHSHPQGRARRARPVLRYGIIICWGNED